MSPDEYLDAVANRLREGGCEVSDGDFNGRRAIIGYRSRFRLRWVATRLHLFTVVVHEPHITPSSLSSFVEEALDYAVSQRGRFKGLQTGAAAIAIQVGSDVERAAVDQAERRIMKRFAAFAWPAIVDLSNGDAYSHKGRVNFGWIYASWIRAQIALAVQNGAGEHDHQMG